MSKYTTEVRYICETYAGADHSEGYDKIREIVEKARPKIFDFDYPIFDPNYKPMLETKIIRHYYTREICCETVGLWKAMLENRMNEIMPYFNKLYSSELLSFNPFWNVDYTRDFQKTNDNTENNTGSTTLSGESQTSRELAGETTEKTDATTILDGETKNTGNETNVTDGAVKDTGTVTDNGISENTKTLDTNKRQVNSGSDVKETANEPKNTRWDIYSDTPQGTLTNVENEEYLTNARKIVDDATGSLANEEMTYGKVVNEAETGNVFDNGVTNNTRTLDTNQKVDSTDTKILDTLQERDDTTTLDKDVKGTKAEDETTSTIKEETGTSTGNTKFTGLEDYLEHMKGKNSAESFSKMLMEFRETFLNIDMMVIDRLNDLFFLLW